MNTVIKQFLAETDDDVLSTFVTGKKKSYSQINVLLKTGKLVGEPFLEQDLISAIEKELVAREQQPEPLKPFLNDPKALIVVKAPELPPPPIIPSQPKEIEKKAKPVSSGHGSTVPPVSDAIKAKLAFMTDDTLLSSIRVFQVFPATSGDMHAPGIKMQDWEEACYDEALSRELDFELEVVAQAAECDKARYGPKNDTYEFDEEAA